MTQSVNGLHQVRLGDLIPKRSGSVNPAKFPEESFDLYSIPAFDEGEPEVVKGEAIGSTKQVVEPGDVLLSKIVPHIRRAWTVGSSRGRRLIASSEWIVFRNERAHPGYLRHALTNDRFHRSFMNTVAGVGGSLMRARPSQVAQLEIALPALSEQRRIAAILDKTDDLRRKRLQATRMVNDLLRASFLEMFGDPVTNPMDWPTTRLGAILSIDRSIVSPEEIDSGTLYVGLENVTSEGQFIAVRPVERGELASAKFAFTGDHILYGKLRPYLGKIARPSFAGICSTDILPLRCSSNVKSEFLLGLLRQPSMISMANGKTSGANLPRLSPGALSDLTIPLPPLRAQDGYARFAQGAAQLGKVFAVAERHHESLRAGLSNQFFSG